MLAAYGRHLPRIRWALIAAGIVVLLVGGAWGGGVFKVLTTGGFDAPNTESARASAQITSQLGRRDVDVIGLYSSPTQTVDDPAFKAAMAAGVAGLRSHPEVSNVESYYDTKLPALVSTDRHATYLAVTINAADQNGKTAAFAKIKSAFRFPGLTSQVGGVVAVQRATDDMAKADVARGESVAFPVVLILLIFIFGGVVAATMPLLVGVLAIFGGLIATRVIASITTVSNFSVNTITLLGLGLAIDYSLLLISRFRREIARSEIDEALSVTLNTAGRTVLFSGLTVALALSSLLIFPQVFLRSIGYGGMAAVLVAMLASLTVLPAILAVLGPRINAWRVPLPGSRRRAAGSGVLDDSLARPGEAQAPSGWWANLGFAVIRRPVVYAVGVLVILAVLAAPFLGVHFAGSDERVMPPGNETRVVSERIAAEFPGGSDAPVEVYLQGVSGPQVTAIENQIRAVKGVTGAEVEGSRGSSTALSVIYQGDRTSDNAYHVVRAIRALPNPPGGQLLVGGRSAQDLDRLDSLGSRLPWMALIMATATFVLLFLAFGSVLVSIQAVLMNLISVGASFGVLVWVFQDGHLSTFFNFTPTGFIEPTIPILILAVLFGLATDYEVFLISSMREAWVAAGDPDRAIVAGLQRTGGIITAAALLLGVVVTGFSASGVVFTKMIGLGMVVALVVDATLVRIVLVPAVLTLFGTAAWWAPGPFKRLHARPAVAGPPDPPPPAADLATASSSAG